jgi:hypothetical protein
VSNMERESPLYWLLDIEAYDFNTGYIQDADLNGKVLILSRQLWSMVRGSEVVSVLIGPGIFRGVAESGNRRADLEERICALMFNPAQLRYDEPLPLVDIINPEIIDPLSSGRIEEIVTIIRKLVLEKGNILTENPLITVKRGSGIPTTAHYQEMIERINVTHISGVQRTRFILGGTNGPLYRPFVKWYEGRKFISVENSKVLAINDNRFGPSTDLKIVEDWMIVEKAGMTDKIGKAVIEEEYDLTLSFLKKNADSYIFKL